MKKLQFWASLVAIVIGFAACNNDDVDVLRFQFDADGQHLPEYLDSLVVALEKNDIVINALSDERDYKYMKEVK